MFSCIWNIVSFKSCGIYRICNMSSLEKIMSLNHELILNAIKVKKHNMYNIPKTIVLKQHSKKVKYWIRRCFFITFIKSRKLIWFYYFVFAYTHNCTPILIHGIEAIVLWQHLNLCFLETFSLQWKRKEKKRQNKKRWEKLCGCPKYTCKNIIFVKETKILRMS